MNPLYGLISHTVIVLALVIAGAVTGDHTLITIGLAYGTGVGAQAGVSNATTPGK